MGGGRVVQVRGGVASSESLGKHVAAHGMVTCLLALHCLP